MALASLPMYDLAELRRGTDAPRAVVGAHPRPGWGMPPLIGATVLPPSADARIPEREAAPVSRGHVEPYAPLAGLDRAAAAAGDLRHAGAFRAPREGPA